MNFAIVNYEYPPLGGGAGNATAQLAAALVRQGHRATVLTAGHAAQAGTEGHENGVRVIRLAVRRRRVDRSDPGEMLSYVGAAMRELPRLLRTEPFTGCIVFFSLPCGPIGWYAQRKTGVPYVIALRGGDVPGAEASVGTMHRVLAPVRRLALRKAVAVVANSRGLAELSMRADPVPVQIVPNGVDTAFFTPGDVQPRPDGVTLLFAGRFQAQKNLFVLLEQFAAASSRASQPMRLVLVGDGPQRQDLQAHARTLGVANAVTWPGWLDKPALRDAYRSADVFLNPSLYEGMPNTVLEAMACGLPVIASRVMGNDELVDGSGAGVLFDLACPDRLAAAIEELAGSAERRAALGRLARRFVSRDYSWDASAARYAALFAQPSQPDPVA
jgi:glycosyltransferase involved in cell wall biosynthesis